MIRVVHTYQYYKKTFLAWDLTVSDYMFYLKEPEETIKKILLEFNKEIPKMNEIHMKNFIKNLFHADENKKTKWEISATYESMRVLVAIVAKQLKQPFSEITHLTLQDFFGIQKDIDVIINPDKFKDRFDWDVSNKRKIKELKNIISN